MELHTCHLRWISKCIKKNGVGIWGVESTAVRAGPLSNPGCPDSPPRWCSFCMCNCVKAPEWFGLATQNRYSPMSSEGPEKWDQVCWSRPCCGRGSGTEAWVQMGTRTQRTKRGRRCIRTNNVIKKKKSWFCDTNLEQVASLAPCGRAQGSHRTERAPEVNVGQQRTWGQQQGGCLRKQVEQD